MEREKPSADEMAVAAAPLRLDVEVTYRSYSGSYQPTEREFLPVPKCKENVDDSAKENVDAAAKPDQIPMFIITGHSFFFLQLNLNAMQCSDGCWNFALLKRPCPANNPRCQLPHLWVSRDGKRYRTQDHSDTVDHRSMTVTQSRKEKPLVLPGRVYDLTFSLDDEWNSCGCDTVAMAITYNSCHSMNISRVVAFKILRGFAWDRLNHSDKRKKH